MGNKNQRYRFYPGDMILISQGVPHAIYSEQKTIMRQTAVHFHAKLFGTINLFDLLGFPCYVPARPDSPFETVSAALARDYALKAPGWECFMACNIMNVLLFIIRHYGRVFKPLQIQHLNHLPPRLAQILTGLDRQLHNSRLTIPKLAEQAGCSPVYLRKLLSSVTGLSPVAFLQRRRIEIACRYLRFTQMSIKEIAGQTGFGDLAYFYRIFKRWTNTTPALYRKD